MTTASNRVQRRGKQPRPRTASKMAMTARPIHQAVGGSRALLISPRMNQPSDRSDPRREWLLIGATILIILGWLGAVYLVDSFRFVIFNPRGKTGFEMFLALGHLFGALVVALAAMDAERARMRWVVTSLLVLGIGALSFGYALPLLELTIDPNVSMYGSLLVRTMATCLLAIGLVPAHVPPLSRRSLAFVLGIGLVTSLAVVRFGHAFPQLVEAADMESLLAITATRAFPDLTSWHLALGFIPVVAACAAAYGAVLHVRSRRFGVWIVIAAVLLAGAQLHSLFWPSMYSSVLTTTSVLRFGLTAVVITGAIFELRLLSQERAALLAEEQQLVRQLQEVGMMKRDFTSMVAHELASPLAAIGNMAQTISLGVLSVADQQKLANRIQGEARILQLLVRDIRASVDIERDDFNVEPRPVAVRDLLRDAEAYGSNLLGDRLVCLDDSKDTRVLADPERIGQVIRNLLNNAFRHTPDDTRITMRTRHHAGGVCIDVEDNGPGIHPAEQVHIFEMFGRGQNAGEGRGLGLYLSRRILQAHGTDLQVESQPGEGACFSFLLREAP